ncbi:MAG: hypothetical protein JSR46_07060, partial [Verrucomicrobia bacterium]|nr:hypothetical protein [Verrucomicrobiota bacterium]
YLHAREARIDKIPKKYATWKAALSELASDIEACSTRILQQSEKLPTLVEPQARLQGFQALSELELNSYHLRRKNKELQLLLNSPEHKKALKLCKEIIKECEQAKELSSLPLEPIIIKAEEQITLQQRTLASCKASLKKSIIAIDQDIVDFLAYVATSKNPADKETQKRLQKLMPDQIAAIEDSELTEGENKLINTFTEVTLPNERYFKCGIIMADWRYPKIYPIIEKMQKAAQGLQQVEIDLAESIRMAWQGTSKTKSATAAELKELLNSLELIIRKHKEELLKIPFCEEVHAGFHYAASLFTWIEELTSQTDFLSKITQDPWLGVCKLQQLFYRQLKLFSKEHTDYERTDNLYEIIITISPLQDQAHSFFANYKNRITTIVIASIGSLAKRLLSPSYNEKSVEESIARRASLFAHELTSLASLISKKIITCLYVTEDAFDIELELILTALQLEPKYEKKTHFKDKRLSQLLTWYKTKSSMDEVKPLLTTLSTFFSQLNQTARLADTRREGEDFSLLYHACSYKQTLFDIQQSLTTDAEKSRFASFLTVIKNLIAVVQKKYPSQMHSYDLHSIEIPEDLSTVKGVAAEKVVYKLLSQAYWGHSLEIKTAALETIQQMVNQPQLNFLSDNLKNLLKTLALGLFLTPDETADISPLEQAYLPPLLKQHLEQPDFWTYLFPIGTLEETLYKALNSPIATDSPIKELLNAFTQYELYPTWRQVIENYLAFRKLAEDKTLEKASEDHTQCQQYLSHLDTIRNNEQLTSKRYKYVFKMLYKEMKKMLDDSLH